MGALTRFYVPKDAWGNYPALVLRGEEAHHCVTVIRKATGSLIEVFDGDGRWAHAKIVSIVGKEVHLEAVKEGITPRPRLELSLLQAIPKGSNMDWIIEKSVELGVRHIQPLLTDRTVVRLDEKEKAKKVAKWERVILEACKQCGQNWLPTISEPKKYGTVVKALPSKYDLALMAALQADSKSFHEVLASFQADAPENSGVRVALAVGPEGDFTEEEYILARHGGFQFVTLGAIVLRVETATLYALSVLSHELNA